MPKRILLTGGRAPAALELARILKKQGHTVFMAECVTFPVARFSRSIAKFFKVPKARFEPHAFAKALEDIAEKEQLDAYIPTCEEVFYAAQADGLRKLCYVWADTFEKLDRLHNKWTFIEYAKLLGFDVPQTRRANSREQLMSLLKDETKAVIKPAYSRFASQTIIWNKGDDVPARVAPSVAQPWVVQEFIDGRHVCTYSVAKSGKLLAHSIYPSQQQWGIGSSTVFESIEHAPARAWVEKFAAASNFTGQLGFDFIEHDGTLFPIECNPRATSGIHLFAERPELADVFTGHAHSCAEPPVGMLYSVKLALVLRLMREVFGLAPLSEIRKTWRFLRESNDVLYRRGDAVPVLGQLLSLFEFIFLSVKFGMRPTEATSYDSGYDGIDESRE